MWEIHSKFPGLIPVRFIIDVLRERQRDQNVGGCLHPLVAGAADGAASTSRCSVASSSGVDQRCSSVPDPPPRPRSARPGTGRPTPRARAAWRRPAARRGRRSRPGGRRWMQSRSAHPDRPAGRTADWPPPWTPSGPGRGCMSGRSPSGPGCPSPVRARPPPAVASTPARRRPAGRARRRSGWCAW
jgi:hypothetical protein